MNLTVVLVNYKCDKRKLQLCLNSIKINTEVLIIDHSHDFNTNDLIIPKNLSVKVIENTNYGNGAGINCGLKNSKTNLVLYLDIDTVLGENFFKKLEESLKKIDTFAVIAPMINGFYKRKNFANRGNLSLIRFYYNKFFFKIKLEKNDLPNIKEVFFVSGAVMLINKANTFNKDIKFDENILMFFEEDDFFHQCFKTKKKIYLIENIEADHFDGSINDKSEKYELFKKWHWEWSKYYFLNKHYNKVLIQLIALRAIFKFCLKIFIFCFFHKKKYKLNKSRLNGLLSFYLKRKCNIDF